MSQYSVSAYTADGSTTDYLITWDYLDEDHITVYVDDVANNDPQAPFSFQLINSTTVRIVDAFGNAIASGSEIEIRRATPITNRIVTFADGSALLASDLNKNSDYLLFSMQESIDTVDTASQNAAQSAAAAADASALAAAASQLAASTSESNASTSESNALSYKTDAETARTGAETALATAQNVLDSFDDTYLGAFATDPTTDNDGDPLTDGTLYYSTTDDVLKIYDTGLSAWVRSTPITSDQNNINILGAIAAEITTVAGDTADINILSPISADIQTLGDLEDGTVATNALSNLGPISADIVTAANNITAIQNAPAEAAAAAASAAAALASETAAATSESNAATSEANASASETAAQAAQAAAETALDTFDDLYLGAKSADPTTDNDGDPLQVGALYYNTTTNVVSVWEGAAWAAAYASLSGSLIAANNLSDLTSTTAARTNLGLDPILDEIETIALAGL